MRILHIVHQYMPEKIGGTELYTQNVAAHQVRAAHDVAIVTPSQLSVIDRSIDENGVRVFRMPFGKRTAQDVFLQTFRNSTALHSQWRQLLDEHRPHLVHIEHLMGVPAVWVDDLVARKIPYVITLHDYWFGCANAQLFTNDSHQNCLGPRAFINCGRCTLARAGFDGLAMAAAPAAAPLLAYRQRQLRKVWNRAAAIISPTHFVQARYRDMGFDQSRVVHIPHGIDVPADLIAKAKAEAAERPRHADLQIAYIGGISSQKGIHTLIEAFNTLPETAALDIYGDLDVFPKYSASLRKLITHPRIQLHGRAPHSQIWSIIANSDAMAMPTHWYEASPLTIQEVFAVGVPLIASQLGAMSEKIQHGVDGLLVPPADVAEWSAMLYRILNEPDLLPRLQRQIKPTRTVSEHLQDVMDVYERAAVSQRHGR